MNVSNNFVNQLKQFITDNNIIGTVAGFCVALATKDVITSFVGDVIIPVIHILLKRLHIKYIDTILPSGDLFNLTNFIKQFVSWIFILIITFFFITYAFETLLGIKGKDSGKDNTKKY